MKKSTATVTVKSSTVKLTAEKKAKRNAAARAKRAYKKTVVNLGSVVIPATSFAEANSIENIEVEQFADTVVDMLLQGATAEEIDATIEDITLAEVVEVAPVKGSPEWAQSEARTFLGATAIVWFAVEDAKGKAFTSPRYRVGLPADKDTGYLIEAGRKIVGAGNSYTDAVKDARKRTEAKSAA